MKDRYWVVILIGIFVFLIGATLSFLYYDETEWNRFAAQHDCKVIGKTSSSSSVGVGAGSNGGVSVVPIITPGKTGYACNDGKQYWR